MKKPYLAEYTVTYRNTCLVFADDEKSAHEWALEIWGNGSFDPELNGDFEGDAEVSPAYEKACLDYQYDAFMDEDHLTDSEVEELWSALDDVPMNPETERMEKPFLIFPAHTEREEIWKWFDKHHSKGIAYLLYGVEPQPAPPAPPAPPKFSVERTIDGRHVLVELTPEEITRAYFAQQEQFDRLDVSDYLNELSDYDCISQYRARREEIIPLIPEIAQHVRKMKNSSGVDFPNAVNHAIWEALRNHGK
ncbi:MAG: hypothetical protein J6Q14_08185 [Oscillospiraceae bacterium]|nr:hypothetical protein [Oscillospiraceae bacterium]